MTTFDDRERAFEQMFVHDEDKRVTLYRATGETGMPQPYAAPNFDVPTLHVSTENEYLPDLEEIALWVESQNFDGQVGSPQS